MRRPKEASRGGDDVIRRGCSRHRATLAGKDGRRRGQWKSSQRRRSRSPVAGLATSSRSKSLAHKEAALDQDEGGNGPRRGWRLWGAGRAERDRRPLYRRG